MKEYIVAVEDDVIAYEEYSVGYIRRQKKLIRCKDCRYHDGRNRCEMCDMHKTADNNFCSYAEPKETS
jgi:hypothetical protein